MNKKNIEGYQRTRSTVSILLSIEEKIENAYDKIFKLIQKMFPSVKEQNEELFMQLWIFQ